MSDFSHSFTQESRARGGQAAKGGDCEDGMSGLRKRNRTEVFERVRGGDGTPKDRVRLMTYYKQDLKEGCFAGSAEEWLELHEIELPAPSQEIVVEHGIVSQALLDVTVQIAGPEVAWGLMVVAGQIPLVPRSRKSRAAIHY